MKRSEIVQYARSFIGVPNYREGRTRGGLDCIGLIQVVGSHFGIQYEDKFGYSDIPVNHEFLSHLMKYLTVNKNAAIHDGTIGLFRQNRYPCHVGIFASNDRGDRTIIHSSIPAKKVVERLYVNGSPMHLSMTLEYPGITDG